MGEWQHRRFRRNPALVAQEVIDELQARHYLP